MGALFALLVGLSGFTPDEPPAPKVTIEKLGEVFEFKVNGELVTKYHTRKSNSKPYLWPLNAPGGVALSRDWPMKPAAVGDSTDHPHQRSAWFGHGDVIPDNITLTSKSPGVQGVDFWHEGLNHGTIECTSVDESDSGKGILRSRNTWKTAEGRPIIDELREIKLVPLDRAYLIVIRITLKSSSGVTFGDTKEGTFAVRVGDRLRIVGNPKGAIINSSGLRGDKDCWGRKADWCDCTGEIDGKPCGIALFDDPKNRSRACWHVRDYGLLSANPFGRAGSGFPAQKDTPEPLVHLKPGEELKLRYAILLHTGEANIKNNYRRFLAD
jgi:Methane oxygenase PmoA